MVIPTAGFLTAQFLREALKVVVAQVGEVFALDSGKEKVGRNTVDPMEGVRQDAPRQKIAAANGAPLPT